MATVTNLVQYFIDGALEGFTSTVLPISKFAYGVNQTGAGLNDVIRVPYVSNASGSSDFTYAAGYTITAGNGVAGKSVTLDKIKYQVWDIADSDLVKVSPQVATSLGVTAGARLGSDVLSQSFAANMGSFSTSATWGAGAFTASLALATLEKQCNDANWPTVGRCLVTNTTIKANMMANTNLSNAYAFGTPTAINAQIPRVYGFDQYTVTCGLGGSSGFAAMPSAMLFGFAYHKPSDAANQVYSQPIIDTKTGLVFGYKEYYDPQYARTVRIIECLYGSAAGDTSALIKIA